MRLPVVSALLLCVLAVMGCQAAHQVHGTLAGSLAHPIAEPQNELPQPGPFVGSAEVAMHFQRTNSSKTNADYRDPIEPLLALHPSEQAPLQLLQPRYVKSLAIGSMTFNDDEKKLSREKLDELMSNAGWKKTQSGILYEVFEDPALPHVHEVFWVLDEKSLDAKVIERYRTPRPTLVYPPLPPSGKNQELILAMDRHDRAGALQAIKEGAKMNESGDGLVSPMDCALSSHNFEMANLLLEHGAKLDPQKIDMMNLCNGDHLDALQYLADHHFDFRVRAGEEITSAALGSQPFVLSDFATTGGDLGTSYWENSPKVAEFLIAHGVSPEALMGGLHETAFQLAVQHGNYALAKTLLDHGANPSLMFNNGARNAEESMLRSEPGEYREVENLLRERHIRS